MPVNLDPDLLSILVCPKCRSEFRVDDEASELVCTNATCALVLCNTRAPTGWRSSW